MRQPLSTCSDLLRRHEKSAHDVDTAKRQRTSTSNSSVHHLARDESLDDSRGSQSCTTCLRHAAKEKDAVQNPSLDDQGSLPTLVTAQDSLSNTTEISRADATFERPIGQRRQDDLPSSVQQSSQVPGHQILPPQQYGLGVTSSPFQYPGVDPFDLFGDGDLILDNVDFASFFTDWRSADITDQGPQLSNNVDVSDTRPSQQLLTAQANGGNVEQNSISRFGSPLPSIRADGQSDDRTNVERHAGRAKISPCYKISTSEHQHLKGRITQLMPALPNDFILPSKHTLSRYLEGCVKGLYEHMPLVHIPTWSVSTAIPELVLAMAAIGAQFKFEGQMAITLFYAAKAAVMYQLRTSKEEKAAESPSQPIHLHAESSLTSPRVLKHAETQDNGTLPIHNSNVYDQRDRLQTMQAIISLMVLGSWGPRKLVGEAIAFQSLLAELVREDGLEPEDENEPEATANEPRHDSWLRWIRAESLRRTKLMAYTFINLQVSVGHVVRFETRHNNTALTIDTYELQANIWTVSGVQCPTLYADI